VGASLLAKAVRHPKQMLTDTTLSRAGSTGVNRPMEDCLRLL